MVIYIDSSSTKICVQVLCNFQCFETLRLGKIKHLDLKSFALMFLLIVLPGQTDAMGLPKYNLFAIG